MIETTIHISEPFDYQKQGYFDNMITGLPYADGKRLISFLSPIFTTVGTIATWKLIGINPVTEIDLGSYRGLVIPNEKGYYYNAELNTITSAPCGIYYMLLTDSFGQKFRTGLFNLNLTGFPPNSGAGLGDFSPEDFNDDFYKTIE